MAITSTDNQTAAAPIVEPLREPRRRRPAAGSFRELAPHWRALQKLWRREGERMDEDEPRRATVASFEDARPRPARACTMAAATAFAVFVCYALFNQPTEEDQREPAAVASPRTPWSSRSANQSRKWTAYQTSLVSNANAYQSGKSSRLVLMGDSITEAWVGTGYGSPTLRAEGVPAVLNETLARHWPPTPLVLAISGDQTQHVLWRVAQGEISKAMARQHGQSIVLAAAELAGHGSRRPPCGRPPCARWPAGSQRRAAAA